tara:strand:+ start:397 stop:849 length:453 start_codon:yes stop_codon:yes gene_type:complete
MTAWIDEAMRKQRTALIEVWWDSQQRLWVTVSKDEDGNQIGDAEWNAHKRDAVAAAKQRQIDEYVRLLVCRCDGNQRRINEYIRELVCCCEAIKAQPVVAHNGPFVDKPSLKIGTRAGGLPDEDEDQVAGGRKKGPALLMKRFKFGPSRS